MAAETDLFQIENVRFFLCVVRDDADRALGGGGKLGGWKSLWGCAKLEIDDERCRCRSSVKSAIKRVSRV